MRISFLILGLLFSAGVYADLPYWICADRAGAKSVQDHACAEAPNAPPAGHVSEYSDESGSADSESGKSGDRNIDTAAVWRQAWNRLLVSLEIHTLNFRDRIPSAGPVGELFKKPWLWLALCALIALWMLIALSRQLIWRFRDWRESRQHAALMRVHHRAEALLRKEPELSDKPKPVPAPQTAGSPQTALPDSVPGGAVRESSETVPAQRFSPVLLRGLNSTQFGEMCVRLWRMRGLRAAFDPHGQSSGQTLILLQKPSAPRKPYGVAICVPTPKAPIGASTVNELLELMSTRGCGYGAIMTPGEFSSEARDRVRGQSIELKGSITLMIELESLADRQRRSLLESILEKPDEGETIAAKDPVI